ncbi:hypothetical protein [Mycobacterium sp. OTB74]|jgi:hypothetical protein|uniref:hypothetical protein n=1 Tax=Mycobacterium sp. OTB74 TaxID=1853452 RepID=UPI002473C1A5|nr:hypothetical protein [Mycobacterium sp. OTB74]MDH6247613.1 hypothetical protein [Mycobacterium sp. OTB74]
MTQSAIAVGNEESEISWSELRDEWNARNIDRIRTKLENEYAISRSDLKTVCEHEEPEADGEEKPEEAGDRDETGSTFDRLFHCKRDNAESRKGSGPEGQGGAAEKVDAAWQHVWEAAAKKNCEPLVAYFVFALGMKKWELSSDHDAVNEYVAHAIVGYRRLHGEHREASTANIALTHFILNELVALTGFELPAPDGEAGAKCKPLLVGAMSVEAAVYAGSSVAIHARANEIAGHCEKCLENELIAVHANHENACGDVQCLVWYVINLHRIYYSCIAQTADAVRRAGDIDPTVRFESDDEKMTAAVNALNNAASRVVMARAELGNDVYASELPPYRATLTAWLTRLSNRSVTPIVALNDVDFTYIYPFALADVDVQEVQEFMRALEFDDESKKIYAPDVNKSGAKSEFSPADLTPKAPVKLQLNDMWTWGGRREELNATVCIPMPPITVSLVDDGRFKWKFDVELLFNDLGNHYLRVKLESKERGTRDWLNLTVRLATTYCGEHLLVSDDDQQVLKPDGSHCKTIADYAKTVIDYVSEWIVRESDNYIDGRAAENEKKYRADDASRRYKSGFQPDFDYHILVVIGSASSPASVDSDANSMKQEIENGYGDLLMQLLNREATTLDEWTCRGKYSATPNLLGDECFPGDFAMGTATTTVLYMPSTPSWVKNGYQEVAEFAASFRPLINEAKKDLEEKLQGIDTLMQTDKDRELDKQERDLSHHRRDLHELLDRMRKIRTYLEPSQLLSLRAEGEFLAKLYKQLELGKLKNDLDGYLERGRIAIDRMNRRESRLHDHRSRHNEDSIQIILLILGVLSFSGFLSLFLTLMYGSSIPGWDTDPEAGEGHPLTHHHLSSLDLYGAAALYGIVLVAVVLYFKRNKGR